MLPEAYLRSLIDLNNRRLNVDIIDPQVTLA